MGWQPSGQNLNSLLTHGGETLVRRARDLCRNNAYARAACDAFAANVVGAGIKPSSLLRSRPQREEIQRAWLEWTDAADADGLTDFYGLQALAARALFEAGECFIRIRERRPGDGLDVPIQLQMLEAEMCPWELNRQEPTGTAIRCGIEVNAIGRRVAYWFHRRHPGDSTEFIQSSAGDFYVRVPANQVIHLYNPLRPGQLRGVPWLTPSMIPLKILGDYDDAELERKRQAALIAGFITVPAPEYDPMNGEDQDDGTALAAMQPGEVLLVHGAGGGSGLTAIEVGKAMGAGLMMVFSVLVLLFSSFLQPITILFSLPLSIGGAFGALLIANQPLSLFVLIGLIMLMGIVTKNGILLIDFTLQRVAEGLSVDAALMEAGPIRLRPILMTTFAAGGGMLPIAIGHGEGGEARSPMGVAVIGGLLQDSDTLTVGTLDHDFGGRRRGNRDAGRHVLVDGVGVAQRHAQLGAGQGGTVTYADQFEGNGVAFGDAFDHVLHQRTRQTM